METTTVTLSLVDYFTFVTLGWFISMMLIYIGSRLNDIVKELNKKKGQ